MLTPAGLTAQIESDWQVTLWSNWTQERDSELMRAIWEWPQARRLFDDYGICLEYGDTGERVPDKDLAARRSPPEGTQQTDVG